MRPRASRPPEAQADVRAIAGARSGGRSNFWERSEMLTVLVNQVCDEVLRYVYVLWSPTLIDILVSGGILALVAAFGLTAWRLTNSARAETRDRPCHL
jgi:hypothetical protein